MSNDASAGWRWANVPVPQAHLAGLVIGGALGLWWPLGLPLERSLALALGAVLSLAGAAVGAWAVRAAGRVNIASPTGLVIGGPYRYSRNPMYVGWTALYIGITLVVESAWPLVFLPAVAVLTHRTVRREERVLAKRFGGDYAAYRERVRRYL